MLGSCWCCQPGFRVTESFSLHESTRNSPTFSSNLCLRPFISSSFSGACGAYSCVHVKRGSYCVFATRPPICELPFQNVSVCPRDVTCRPSRVWVLGIPWGWFCASQGLQSSRIRKERGVSRSPCHARAVWAGWPGGL